MNWSNIDWPATAVVGGGIAFVVGTALREFRKGWSGGAPRSKQPEPGQLVAAALGMPATLASDLATVKDAVGRTERHAELGAEFADDVRDELRDMRLREADRAVKRAEIDGDTKVQLTRIEAAIARLGSGRGRDDERPAEGRGSRGRRGHGSGHT